MELVVHDDERALAAAAAAQVADLVAGAIGARGDARVVFATGNSQLGFLDALRSCTVEWSVVDAFHLDEYVGVGRHHPAGFVHYLEERVVRPLRPRAFHAIDGLAPDPAAEARRYAALVGQRPLDVVVAGIGENGHLAFNDPPFADFDDPQLVKVVTLDERSRRQQVGEGHFADLAAVPRQAITLTIPAIVGARHVVVVCPEQRKAAAVRAALEGPVTPECPASVLRTCDHASVHLDRASASQLAR
jgi:glucosamine-6-phosphate deaminase